MYRRFHTYAIDPGVLAFGGATPVDDNFLVEPLYDFIWTKGQAFIYDAVGVRIDPDIMPRITVIIAEGSSAQPLCDETPVGTLFGTGRLPFILPAPHVIAGGTTITVQLNNRHTATAYSCALAFSGVLVERGQGEALVNRNAARKAG